MKFIIAFSAILAVVCAQGHVDVQQDTAGSYSVNVNSPGVNKNEQRFPDGKVIGSYNYVDDKGISHTVTYVASEQSGFLAQGAEIPVAPRDYNTPVQDTPEVSRARSEHLAAVEREKALNPSFPGSFNQF